MAIIHDDFTFNDDHGVIVPAQSPELPLIVGRFPGLIGEAHLIDNRKGRLVFCEYSFERATYAAVKNALDILNTKIGELTGDVQVTGLAATAEPFRNCTFVGYETDFGPHREASRNKWIWFGRLIWRQRTA